MNKENKFLVLMNNILTKNLVVYFHVRLDLYKQSFMYNDMRNRASISISVQMVKFLKEN